MDFMWPSTWYVRGEAQLNTISTKRWEEKKKERKKGRKEGSNEKIGVKSQKKENKCEITRRYK